MNGDDYEKILKRSRREAHQLLFDEYYNYVGTIVFNQLRNVGSAEDTEECISDVFAKMFFVLEDQPVTGDMKKFIAMIARNSAISMRRSLTAKTDKNISADDEDMAEIADTNDIEADTEKAETSALLLKKISELGPPDCYSLSINNIRIFKIKLC